MIQSFFESGDNGAFSLSDLSLLLRNLPPVEGFFKSIRNLQDEDERLSAWLDATAYFHEMRHFHDLVGTPSGLAIFLETTRLTDALVVALIENGDGNMVPLNRRAPDGPPARLYRSHHALLAALLGDGARPNTAAEQDDDELKKQEYNFPDLGLDFILPLVDLPRLDLNSGETVESQVPLGLRALMEHTATEIQLFLAMIGAGDDPFTENDGSGRAQRFFDMFQQLFRGQRTAYILLRWFVQMHNIGRHGKRAGLETMPGAGSLMALTQAALDIGGYAYVRCEGWFYEHPGMVFAHLLTRCGGSSASFEADIDAVDEAVASFIGLSWREFLTRHTAQMERRLESVIPPHLAPGEAFMPLIGAIRQIALEDHLSIMRSKAEDLHKWVNPAAYVAAIKDLPKPPLNVAAKSHVAVPSSNNVSQFLLFSMLLAIVEGIMETGQIKCVIETRFSPMIDLFQFPDPSNPSRSTRCHSFVENKLCGRYAGRFLLEQPPQCPFAILISRLLGDECGIKLHFEEATS